MSEAQSVSSQVEWRQLTTKFAALADYAVVRDDGKMTIVGTFQDINGPVLPLGLPHMYLAYILQADPTEPGRIPPVAIQFEDPNGQVLAEFSATWDLPDSGQLLDRPLSLMQVVGVGSPSFELEGRYAFRILANGEEIGQVPLFVTVVPE